MGIRSRSSPDGLFARFRRHLREPADLWWLLRIGFFLWRVPMRLEKESLPRLLERLTGGARPANAKLSEGIERIGRLQGFWLRRSFFRSRDTCYVRALTFFRFLDPGSQRMRIHYVVEIAREGDRRRGHAWVSVGGQPLLVPEDVQAGAIREIFVFPPLDDVRPSCTRHPVSLPVGETH